MNDLHQSFSGMIRQAPQQVAYVRTEEEACAAIGAAYGAGMPVNFRGSGHSFGDHCISDGGLLLVNDIQEPLKLQDDGVVQVPTGLSWNALERRLNQHGRSAPVLTNWLGATVGGTLAYGGFGVASFRRGAQADHVLRLRYVGAAGLQELAPGDDAWSVGLCSAGALGFVTSVDMATVGFLPWLEEAWIVCRDEHDMAVTLPRLARAGLDIEMLWAQLSAGELLIGLGRRTGAAGGELAGVLATAGIAHDSLQIRPWDAWLDAQSTRKFPRERAYLWSDYVVPAACFAAFFSAAYAAIYRTGAFAVSRPRIRLLVVDRSDSPASTHALNPVNFDDEQLLFGIGVYLEPPLADSAAVAAAQACLHTLLELCLAVGGRPYLATWHRLTSAEGAAAYPGQWERARTLVERHADRRLTNPGAMPPL